jgi:hypothetical protein
MLKPPKPVPDLPLCLGVLKHGPAKKKITMDFCLCGAILNLKAFCFGAIPDIMIICFPSIAQTLEHFTELPKHTYTRPWAAAVTSLLYSICNFDFVVTIVIVQMCLAFKKSRIFSVFNLYV